MNNKVVGYITLVTSLTINVMGLVSFALPYIAPLWVVFESVSYVLKTNIGTFILKTMTLILSVAISYSFLQGFLDLADEEYNQKQQQLLDEKNKYDNQLSLYKNKKLYHQHQIDSLKEEIKSLEQALSYESNDKDYINLKNQLISEITLLKVLPVKYWSTPQDDGLWVETNKCNPRTKKQKVIHRTYSFECGELINKITKLNNLVEFNTSDQARVLKINELKSQLDVLINTEITVPERTTSRSEVVPELFPTSYNIKGVAISTTSMVATTFNMELSSEETVTIAIKVLNVLIILFAVYFSISNYLLSMEDVNLPRLRFKTPKFISNASFIDVELDGNSPKILQDNMTVDQLAGILTSDNFEYYFGSNISEDVTPKIIDLINSYDQLNKVNGSQVRRLLKCRNEIAYEVYEELENFNLVENKTWRL